MLSNYNRYRIIEWTICVWIGLAIILWVSMSKLTLLRWFKLVQIKKLINIVKILDLLSWLLTYNIVTNKWYCVISNGIDDHSGSMVNIVHIRSGGLGSIAGRTEQSILIDKEYQTYRQFQIRFKDLRMLCGVSNRSDILQKSNRRMLLFLLSTLSENWGSLFISPSESISEKVMRYEAKKL